MNEIFSIIVAVLSILVTVLVCFHIYNIIDYGKKTKEFNRIKKEFDFLKERCSELEKFASKQPKATEASMKEALFSCLIDISGVFNTKQKNYFSLAQVVLQTGVEAFVAEVSVGDYGKAVGILNKFLDYFQGRFIEVEEPFKKRMKKYLSKMVGCELPRYDEFVSYIDDLKISKRTPLGLTFKDNDPDSKQRL